MSAKKDFYKLLEVNKKAGADELKKSYYRLAKKYHPDKNPDNPGMAEKFKAIKEAYETLSDPVKKADYDRELSQPTAATTSSRPTGAATSGTKAQRYQGTGFSPFFNQPPGATAQPNPRGGARFYTVNYQPGSTFPLEDIMKMFFGGMSDFGPQYPRSQQQQPRNPNAAAICQFCRQLYTIQELIVHQKSCSQRPRTEADYDRMFPDDSGVSRPTGWRQQHHDTQEAIRRDRENAARQQNFSDNFEFEMHQSGLIDCPTCLRRFNFEAAQHHIPFCRRKATEANFSTRRDSGGGVETPTTEPNHKSAYERRREYEQSRKKNPDKNNNNHNNSNSNNRAKDQPKRNLRSGSPKMSGEKQRPTSRAQNTSFNIFWRPRSGQSAPEEHIEDEVGSQGPLVEEEEQGVSCDDDDDVLNNQYWGVDRGGRTSMQRRGSMFPDIRTGSAYTKPQTSKTRRNTTAGVYETAFPSYNSPFTFRGNHGCDRCVRIFGVEGSRVHCSCGFKKSTAAQKVNMF